MMKRVIYFVAIIATCGLGIPSCEKNMENEQPPADTGNTMEVAAAKNMLTVGEKLENPYSVANMQKAQDALHESGMLKNSAAIEPTHLYVRFLPKNEEELDLIDSYNQRMGYNGQDYADDPVSGYSLDALYDILINKSYGLASLSENLKKQKPSGVTNDQITCLIESIATLYDK